MTITADEIRKAAMELIGEMAQGEYECIGADGLSAKVTIGYIVGAKDFAEKMIEMIEEGYRVAMGAMESFTKESENAEKDT